MQKGRKRKGSSRRDRLLKQRQLSKEVGKVNNGGENKNRLQKKEIMTETAEPIEQVVEQPQKTATQSGGFNPFSNPVEEREYTRDMIEADFQADGMVIDENPIPEPTYERPNYSPENESIASSAAPNPAPSSNEGASTATPIGESSSNSSSAPTSSPNPDLQDLSEAQKRKAAKKTAEVILTSYEKFAPMPFKKIASFNMTKMKKLDMNGQISLNMVVQNDGTTVGSYMEGVNKQVEEIFKITEEMKNDLRDPLIDVLMEQDLALTPTQRLMIAAGGQVVQMGVHSVQLLMSNKDAIKTFKSYHEEQKAHGFPQQPPQPQQAPVAEEQFAEATNEEQAYEAPAVDGEANESSDQPYDPPTFGIDDYVNDNTDEK